MLKEIMTKNNIVIALLLILTLFLISQNFKNKNIIKEQQEVYLSTVDTLKVFKNKNNEQIATIRTIQTELKKFLSLKTNDQEIVKLQNEVKEYKKQLKDKGSATVVSVITKIDTVVVTNIVRDTIKKDTITFFESKFKNKWIDYYVKSSLDSTNINIKIHNDYAVIIGEEGGLFKKKVPIAIVENKNPYSETQQLRTYEVKIKKPSRFGIGPIVGYGTGDDFKFKAFIGIGFTYSIIKF